MQALEKSKYEQSLESVRRFIAIAEKELELYYRHIALYGDPNNRNPIAILDSPTKDFKESGKPKKESNDLSYNGFSPDLSEMDADSTYQELSEIEDDFEDEDLSISESDSEDDSISDLDDEKREDSSSMTEMNSSTILGSSRLENLYNTENKACL